MKGCIAPKVGIPAKTEGKRASAPAGLTDGLSMRKIIKLCVAWSRRNLLCLFGGRA